MIVYNDETLMTWGQYEGVNLGSVPASYLLYHFDENKKMPDEHPALYQYIKDNESVLRTEANMGDDTSWQD